MAGMRAIPTFSGIKYTDTDFFKFQQLMALGAPNALTGPDEMMVRVERSSSWRDLSRLIMP
jgi:hypothetical protein